MTRPSHNTDRRLLAAGRALVSETGFSGLKVREVARRARVNLGMFHYHFKTKEQFTRQVLQEIYEDFFGRFHLESSGEGSPLDRLRRALNVFGRFARDNRALFVILLREAMQGHRETIAFAKANIPRHAKVIMDLLKECGQKRRVKQVPWPMAMTFLLGTMGVPNVVVGMLERVGVSRPFGIPQTTFKDVMLSDKAIGQRIELALAGLGIRKQNRRKER